MAIGPPGAGQVDADREQYLACGRALTLVWQHAHSEDAPDPHTARCPYCRQALRSLAALEQATTALRTSARTGGHHLAADVMRAVRAELRLGRILPLDAPGLDLRVAENTAAKLLRQAADHVPGARAASCRLAPVGGTAVRVSMTLAADPRRPLRPLAAQVRAAVLRAAEQGVGLRVQRVDIRITDLLPPSDVAAALARPGASR